MKILFLVVSYHTMNFFKKMAEDLKSEGHHVRVLAIDDLPYGATEDGFDTHRVDWHLFDWALIDRFNPDRVIIFNGYFRKIHAASMLLKKRYATFFAEVAWFPQNDYIYLDCDIHHRTNIAKQEVDRRSLIGPSHVEALQKLRLRYLPSEAKEKNWKSPIPLPSEFILLPLQLERDTSILYASDIFKDMNSLVGYVSRNAGGSSLIVKTHPKMHTDEVEDKLKIGGDSQSVLKQEMSMNDLSYKATLIVGINSTSIMEAMIHYKPILQMGNNIANHGNQGPFYSFNYYSGLKDSVKVAFDHAKKGLSDSGKDYYDRVLLHMLSNQIDFRDPPRWAIEKIINYNTASRTMDDIVSTARS